VSGYTANDVTWRFMAAQGQHLALIKMKFGSEEQCCVPYSYSCSVSGWVWEHRKFKSLDMYYVAILPVFTCMLG